MDDNEFGVPAGWYPDPLGLPQLRWWDAQAWTEHTSEARAPIVIQPTESLAYAADLPSRREQRERERQERGETEADSAALPDEAIEAADEAGIDGEPDELSAQPLLAMTLLELEPPVGDTLEDPAPGPRRATFHANAAPAASTLSALAEEMPSEAEAKRARTYTGAVWIIALMPLIQIILLVLLVTVLQLGSNLPLMATVVFAPYLAVIGLAFYDHLLLQVWGHARAASGFWAILSTPVFLVVRGIVTSRQTGKGFAPLAIFGSSLMAVLVGILVVPGIAIGLFPQVFAAEAAQSVQADSTALGADISVECPPPPLLIGDSFTCIGTKSDGETDSIAVSLQRQNGWIDWRVEDWGNWVVAD